MGNLLSPCFCDAGALSRRHESITASTKPLDDDSSGIGHSFCYIRPDQFGLLSSISTNPFLDSADPRPPKFRTISGASISANASTPLSTALFSSHTTTTDNYPSFDRAASFESSPSFASVPLQPIPRDLAISAPLPTRNSGSILGSGPIDQRGFSSGPIERGFLSGPMDNRVGDLLQRTLSRRHHHHHDDDQVLLESKGRFGRWISIKGFGAAIVNAFSRSGSARVKELEWGDWRTKSKSIGKLSSRPVSLDEDSYGGGGDNRGCHVQCHHDQSGNLQWAKGKAGEDRVHVVVSEDYGWVFVGIYDGFNGPDAPDFLLSNLYSTVHKELLVLLGTSDESEPEASLLDERINSSGSSSTRYSADMENDASADGNTNGHGSRTWKCRWDREYSEPAEKRTQRGPINGHWNVKHSDVLKALSEGLRKTEKAYFDMGEKVVAENPELFMMGSCVLVMLMMGGDVYLMNVGDSRAVIGGEAEPLEKYGLKDVRDAKSHDHDPFDDWPNITPLQLTVDHNTYVKEEVQRIRDEHLDDPRAVVNDCVKASLKVTRAFGAGFLKQPKWNEGLLEMFKIDYVGNSPYITCSPSLCHHKLGPKDKFLILSSDGLYQYLTNEEAVSHVDMFMSRAPEGDPAQYLVEEVLFRAAKKAGMDFHELLDIPQGERRKYHDDVSVIVVSLEGSIWRSSM